ncbi:MAG: DUF6148 family protein [Methyloceanibacter sp.]|nr:DUF6148 family protein [Methyloceanibacter sp.]
MDLTTAQSHLDAWLAADLRVATGQSYTISSGGSTRVLTRADADTIKDRISYWQGVVKTLTATRAKNPSVRIATWS